MSDFTTGLNDAQRQAVEHGDGPLLILAGAGSGKTKTLTHRIAHLVQNKGLAGSSILAVTFTNKAAKEMRERLAHLLGEDASHRGFMPWMGTFHSICVRILRYDGEHIEIPKNFVILDETDRLSFIKQVMKEQGISEKSYSPRSVASLISGAKNEGIRASEYAETASLPLQRIVADVFPRYETMRRNAKALDFDDLLLETVRLFTDVSAVLDVWRRRFQYILVDEYQDTNKIQYKLIKLLTGEKENICVVGDDWQCLPAGALVTTQEGQKLIETVQAGDVVLAAAGYGKTHAATVARVRHFSYDDELFEVQTASGRVFRATPRHIMFARFEPTNRFFVYLMYVSGKGYRIGLAKGTRNSGQRDGISLRVRANQERAERIWVLATCETRADAQYHEALYSYTYGIPMLVFRADNNRAMSLTQQQIDRLYAAIDTEKRVEKLFTDLLLQFDYPHFVSQATTRHGRAGCVVNLVLFGDKRSSTASPWSSSRLPPPNRRRLASITRTTGSPIF